MARDFARVVSGRDYFHAPQPLGPHFEDPRCYYNELRPKADWAGPTRDGVPLVYFPILGETIAFPITILQFGLGAMDRWLLESDDECLRKAEAAVEWVLAAMAADGSLPNRFSELQPGKPFYSDNSGMAQGQAISLLVRMLEHGRLGVATANRVENTVHDLAASLLRPVEAGGAALRQGDDLAFCEVCRKDDHVILNGWVFALFGLRDYALHTGSPHDREAYDQSVATLARRAPEYLQPDNWSRYDNDGRVSSPFYHQLHIALIDAVVRLDPHADALRSVLARLRDGDTPLSRARYTAAKAWRKLVERTPYATTGGSEKKVA